MAKKAKDKSKKPASAAAAEQKPVSSSRRRFARYLLVLLLAGASVFAWLSVLSFDPHDAPATTVYPPQPLRNVGGPVGAQLAYGLLYWLGGGAYVLLLVATVAAAVMLAGGRIRDWPWRLVGAMLLVTAASAGSHILRPVSDGGFLEGNGGILGITIGGFLMARFGAAGCWLVLLMSLAVGVMLTADNMVLGLASLVRRLRRRRAGAPAGGGWPTESARRADLGNMPASPRAVAAAPARSSSTNDKDLPVAAAGPVAFREPAATRPKKLARSVRSAPAGGQYQVPPADLLADPAGEYLQTQEAAVLEKRAILQQTLEDFGVDAEVVGHMTGPVISMFELALAAGVKVSQVSTLAADIARALAVPGVRVVSPLPGRDTVGIEVPNLDKEIVRLKELMSLAPDAAGRMQLPLYLGKDAAGRPIVADLSAMPHLLLAGTTGSGKSVCINSIISAILMTRPPEDVRLILIDPKMVEMAAFERIPHLLCPIVNDMRRAEEVLEWAVVKMDERYELLKAASVRNIVGYNRLGAEELFRRFEADTDQEKAQILTHMPYYIIIIDELADLIMTSSKEVENHIIRIAQKARAVGIHLLVATQRPSVNVVTGLIKSNMPCRISFRVASRQESRIVLDQNGADVLLGQGDMLFLQPGTSHLIRAQGTYVDESEVRALVEHVCRSAHPVYEEELVRIQSGAYSAAGGQRDELFDKAVEIVLASQRGSVSLLQRRLAVGYSRASRIVDQMAEAGILGDYKGSQARECMMTLDDWYALKESVQADQSDESAFDLPAGG